MVPRMLVVSAAFGSGHLQAARAIEAACRTGDPDSYAEVVDIAHPAISLASSGYLALVSRAPMAYRALYRAQVGNGTRRLIHTVLAAAVRREIARVRPSAVVATHPFPGSAAAYLRRQGLLQAPVAMVLTDFLPHSLWVHEGVDHYFVAADYAARQLRAMGVSGDQISVTGIPLRPEFARGLRRRPSPWRTRRVLVMGGGLGLGPVPEAVRSLLTANSAGTEVTVVTGANEVLRRELETLMHPRLTVLGYTDRIPELMTESDLLVTKPGGLTCSEALACSLPMLLLPPLPGHEEENTAYLTGTGAALSMPAGDVGRMAAHLLLEAPERLASMREVARQVGRPHAAESIANKTFTLSTHAYHADATA